MSSKCSATKSVSSITEEQMTNMMKSKSILRIHNTIKKSASDKRNYHGFELKNQMKVMVISDPETDKAAAAMCVNIGYFSDPTNFPGLAHFLEHMLFMGTEKYPDEDDYSKFIAQHAGMCNAYTTGEDTNFYFDVKQDKLRDVLDRFAQFFIAPTFDESGTDREVEAVNSEHQQNVMSDGWRLSQVDSTLSDPDHDYFKFGTGTKVTLKTKPEAEGHNTLKELLAFHAKHYSSNIMSLVVLGAEPVEQLTEMVVEMFSEIVNKNVTVPFYENHPYRPQDLKIRMNIVPVKATRFVLLKFPIPDQTDKYESKPCGYLSHLIGHEGAGSLLSSLKNRGWVDELSAGPSDGGLGWDTFEIYTDLTEEGIKNVDEVVEITFQYINMLRSSKPDARIFEEIRDLANTNFRFKDKSQPASCVTSLAASMREYPMEEVLCANRIVTKFEPTLIQEILTYIVPENLRMAVMAKAVEEKADQTEKWYGTNYGVEKIPNELIEKWTNAPIHAEHHLPHVNEFLATNFDIAANSSPTAVPYLLKKTDLSRLWFKQDDTFKLPKAILKFEFSSLRTYESPRNVVMTRLFMKLINDSLNEYAYDADIAGLTYSLVNSHYGIGLNVSGYNQKQIVLLEKIMRKFAGFKVCPKRFKIFKEKLERYFKNFKADQPSRHAIYYSEVLRTETQWTIDELLASFEGLHVEQLENFIVQFLSELHVESLVHGNYSPEEAVQIINMVEHVLTDVAKTSPKSGQRRFQDLQIDDGKTYVYHQKHTVRDISACDNYYQVGGQSLDKCTKLTLLEQVINDPCFNVLRTKEQLGYSVGSSVNLSNGVCGLKITVQSKCSPDYLDGRIEAFVDSILELLEQMSEQDYSEHVVAVKTRLSEKPKKLSNETVKHWAEISCRQYDFHRDSKSVEHLNSVTKESLIEFYKEYVQVHSPTRSKLAVYIIGTHLDSCGEAPGDITGVDKEFLVTPPLRKAVLVTDVGAFKEGRKVFPRVPAAMDIDTCKMSV